MRYAFSLGREGCFEKPGFASCKTDDDINKKRQTNRIISPTSYQKMRMIRTFAIAVIQAPSAAKNDGSSVIYAIRFAKNTLSTVHGGRRDSCRGL
jgi:hypothetical protein